MAYTYEYPRPGCSVDIVVFGIHQHSSDTPELQVLLVERRNDPFKGWHALPGGYVNATDEGDKGEDIEAAAYRELMEETGIRPARLEQVCTMGKPERHPLHRVISVVYTAFVRLADHKVVAGDDAKEASWSSVRDALSTKGLAFDHNEMLRAAYERLCLKVRHEPIGLDLMPPAFPLSNLRALYEAILMRKLDHASFRQSILATNILKEAAMHGDVRLYRFNTRAYDEAAREGLFLRL